MRWFKITLAYDGRAYCGWQLQDGQPTVQQAIEEGLAEVTGQQIRVTASGRTDSGVHAAAQVVSCAIDTTLPAHDLGRALHANTPHDIYIL
ncbi:MAG: tRNA pseudouridine(38-40) synthase TruA, partial [Pirellulaceae bacterium]|nr:tRNA pseudouridine(38-40) synthase TruA [Pirellulaceae bacterium]